AAKHFMPWLSRSIFFVPCPNKASRTQLDTQSRQRRCLADPQGTICSSAEFPKQQQHSGSSEYSASLSLIATFSSSDARFSRPSAERACSSSSSSGSLLGAGFFLLQRRGKRHI